MPLVPTPNGDYSLLQFGQPALNGATDDGPIINLALSEISAAGGGRLLIPPGKVAGIGTTVGLPNNTEIVIPTSSTLKAVAGLVGPVIQNLDQTNGNTLLAVTGGGVIDGNAIALHAVRFTKVTLSEVFGIQAKSATLSGIFLNNSNGNHILNVDSRNNSQGNVGVHFGIAFGGTSSHNVTAACRGTDDQGVSSSQQSGWGEVAGMTGDYNVYAGCSFEGNVSAGPPPVVGANSGSTTTGVFSAPSIVGGTLTNPIIAGPTPNVAGQLGMNVLNHLLISDGVDVSTIIDDDTAASGALAGFYPSPTLAPQTARVQLGKGADVLSANNLTLGTDGNYFSVTGTTQVNLLESGAWQSGSVVILKFNAACTVKHNQAPSSGFRPMQLLGGVDFVAANGSTLTLVLDQALTGSWIETSRKAT